MVRKIKRIKEEDKKAKNSEKTGSELRWLGEVREREVACVERVEFHR